MDICDICQHVLTLMTPTGSSRWEPEQMVIRELMMKNKNNTSLNKELRLTSRGTATRLKGMTDAILVDRAYDVIAYGVNIGRIKRVLDKYTPYWVIEEDRTSDDNVDSSNTDITGKMFTGRRSAVNFMLATYMQHEFEKLLDEPELILG